jgi:biotin transport system substrate-specific component
MSTQTGDVDLVSEGDVLNVARAAMLAALVGAFAYVSFPFPVSPAPVTLQVLGVFLAGILLGPRWGAISLGIYLAAGALGAPIFASGSGGFGVLLGRTAGYLWSYPIAAALVGAIAHGGLRTRPIDELPLTRLVGGMLAGIVVIYAMGVAGIMIVLGLGLTEAIVGGALVFIPAEGAKMAAAVGIVRNDALAVD